MSEILELANQWVAAMQTNDKDALRKIYDPNAVFWNNLHEVNRGVEEMLAIRDFEEQLVDAFRFEDTRLGETTGGFVVQMTVRGTMDGGEELRIPVCGVVQVEAGRIVHFDEYVNHQHVAPLLEKLGL